MKALFPAWSNSAFRFALGAGVALAIGVPCLAMAWVRTPYMTGADDPPAQPIKFDHRHHVRDDGIDCLYCHSGATRSAYAGLPSVSVCMNCHSQIWSSSPELAPLRAAYFADAPISWVRVDNLPRHVFFDHSVHVAKGVGCVTCHGRVDLMPQVYQARTLLMQWCLDCHRHPESHLRPPEEITNMEWEPAGPPEAVGQAVQAQLNVHPSTDCTTCHR